jgi:hypothetical protein
MTMWLERLRPSDLHAMLPQVVLRLDQIRDQAMEPERRLAMLRALKDQVESIYCALSSARPPRVAKADGPERDRTLTLEQRLTRSWCTNLQGLLTDLSQPRYRGQARFAIYREWTLRQLLKGMAEAIERAVREERPAAPGTWRALHGLFVFLEGRDELSGPDIPMRYRFHPGTEYKRLLLIGALGEYPNAARILRETGPKLREWGAASELRRDLRANVESHLLRLDLSADLPPQRTQRWDEQPYREWVLEPAQGYRDYVELYRLRLRLQDADLIASAGPLSA